jgi:hypothetical protein
MAAWKALAVEGQAKKAGVQISWQVVTIDVDGCL